MSEKKFGTSRKWLNPKGHSDTGTVGWEVSADKYNVNARLDILDCSRRISLNFDIWEEKDAKIRADKLNMLIDELTKMREAMADAYQYHSIEKGKDDGEDGMGILSVFDE